MSNPNTATRVASLDSDGSVNDSVGTMAQLRSGALSIASQAANDVIIASSASQLSRVAIGTSLQYLRVNSGATGYEFAGIAPTLIKEGSGTSSNAAANNLDTFALASTLTIKDTLYIVALSRNTGNAANIQVSVYNSTDSVDMGLFQQANNNYYLNTVTVGAQSTTRIASSGIRADNTVLFTRTTFTTAWTGAWTLALRSGGVTAPDTLEWAWRVYKIAGQ